MWYATLKRLGIERRTPYALRHSFASLLSHEGWRAHYVARQLGHNARLTEERYGHVMDGLDDAPLLDADTAIRRARESSGTPVGPSERVQ